MPGGPPPGLYVKKITRKCKHPYLASSFLEVDVEAYHPFLVGRLQAEACHVEASAELPFGLQLESGAASYFLMVLQLHEQGLLIPLVHHLQERSGCRDRQLCQLQVHQEQVFRHPLWALIRNK